MLFAVFTYQNMVVQDFPQVLRTWGRGAPQNLMGGGGGGGLSQNMGEHGGLKIQSKNTREGVHLIVKLPAINMQASKFTKNELLHTYFSRILARF